MSGHEERPYAHEIDAAGVYWAWGRPDLCPWCGSTDPAKRNTIYGAIVCANQWHKMADVPSSPSPESSGERHQANDEGLCTSVAWSDDERVDVDPPWVCEKPIGHGGDHGEKDGPLFWPKGSHRTPYVAGSGYLLAAPASPSEGNVTGCPQCEAPTPFDFPEGDCGDEFHAPSEGSVTVPPTDGKCRRCDGKGYEPSPEGFARIGSPSCLACFGSGLAAADRGAEK